jgi:transcriptional regulator with XRE-family HTH domain
VPEVRSPTLRRRELGALLRARRLALGLTVDQVAERLLCSPSKVSRMETGQRGATARDVRDLCDLYGVSDAYERERLMVLAREGKQQGWWQAYALPYTTYVGLEQEATSIKIYHSGVVPGLFQISNYTRAVHQAGIPRFDDPIIEERVKERLTRQQLLTREDPPQVEVVLDEAVLRRPVGGPSVMREQLERILIVSEQPNVMIQVVPYEIGAHPALESDFIILAFRGEAPSLVYVEGLVGQIYVERPQDVERYMQVFQRLRNIAANPKDSRNLLAKIRDTYISDLRSTGQLPETFTDPSMLADNPAAYAKYRPEWVRCPLWLHGSNLRIPIS